MSRPQIGYMQALRVVDRKAWEREVRRCVWKWGSGLILFLTSCTAETASPHALTCSTSQGEFTGEADAGSIEFLAPGATVETFTWPDGGCGCTALVVHPDGTVSAVSGNMPDGGCAP